MASTLASLTFPTVSRSVGRLIDSPSPCPPFVQSSLSRGPIRPRQRFRGIKTPQTCRVERPRCVSISASSLDFTGSFFEGGDDDGEESSGFVELEKREAPKCPPGLRHYETMAVLRPDISEEERLSLTQKYEEVSI
eukprot:Gb_07403 [translate_table: standard]